MFYEFLFISRFVHDNVSGVWSLRDLRVSVPEAVKVGSPAILNCFFDMEGEALYSLRWYRNQEEFFRYTPKETPSAKKFAVAGIPENYIEVRDKNYHRFLTF